MEDESAEAPPPSSDQLAEGLEKMESLVIREEEAEEEKKGRVEGLKETEDSSIKAVRNLSAIFLCDAHLSGSSSSIWGGQTNSNKIYRWVRIS